MKIMVRLVNKLAVVWVLVFSTCVVSDDSYSSLKLPKGVVARVLNGEGVARRHFDQEGRLMIPAHGRQQLLVTLSLLVKSDGRDRKFNSQPFILDFDLPGGGSGGSLLLKIPAIRTLADAEHFEQSPVFRLASGSGAPLTLTSRSLRKSGFQNVRNYVNDVEEYNQSMVGQGYASDNKKLKEHELTRSLSGKSGDLQEVNPSTGNAKINLMKSDFTKLSSEQKIELLQWELDQLKRQKPQK